MSRPSKLESKIESQKSLCFNAIQMTDQLHTDKKCVVAVIGGGTGSFSVLSGLGPYENLWVHSIVTMMDSGGDSGRLRDEFGMLPPGDIRRCLVALSEESKLLRDLFSFRFVDAPLENRVHRSVIHRKDRQ